MLIFRIKYQFELYLITILVSTVLFTNLLNLLFYLYYFVGLLSQVFLSWYFSRQVKSRPVRWAGLVALMRKERKVYKVLVGKPEGKGPLRRPRHRWEDGIRMDLGEIGLGVWIGFDWLRTVTGGGLL
jgi:hypothetical protein